MTIVLIGVSVLALACAIFWVALNRADGAHHGDTCDS